MMALIEEIIGKTVTEINATDIFGAVKITDRVFWGCTKLASIVLPETVEEIGINSFNGCTSLQNIDLRAVKKISLSAFDKCSSLQKVDLREVEKISSSVFDGCTKLATINTESLPEICNIDADAFTDTPWFKALPNGLNLLSDGKIALYAKNVSAVEIPASVRTISIGAFKDVAAPSITVPDTVVRIWGSTFTNSATTKVTIGAGVQIMGVGTMDNTKITTWICRQPTNMILDIPKEAGDGKGLAYNKDSRSFTLYTDNEMLKAYNWAGDNVTATIKPLSEAPA